MDGQAKNNRDNVLFTSMLIGLSVDFCDGGTCVWCARARVCVRESVRALVCVCVIVKML